MLVSTQQSISDLSGWKTYFSELKDYFQTYGLNKEGVDLLYQQINDTLPRMSIRIGRNEGIRLRSILSDFNQDQNYRGNTGDCEFMIDLTTSILKKINGREQQEQNPRQERTASIRRKPHVLPIEQRMPMEERLIATEPISVGECINTLQIRQDNLQQQLDNLEANKPFITKREKRRAYDKTRKDLKSELNKIAKEKWKVKLDQTSEENRNEPLNKVADRTGSRFINRVIEENLSNNKYFYMKDREGYQYRTLGEIADRLSSSTDINYRDQDRRTDRTILFKDGIDEIKTFLEDKDKTLTKEDRKALKGIRKDLEKLRETGSVLPWSRMEAVCASHQAVHQL